MASVIKSYLWGSTTTDPNTIITRLASSNPLALQQIQETLISDKLQDALFLVDRIDEFFVPATEKKILKDFLGSEDCVKIAVKVNAIISSQRSYLGAQGEAAIQGAEKAAFLKPLPGLEELHQLITTYKQAFEASQTQEVVFLEKLSTELTRFAKCPGQFLRSRTLLPDQSKEIQLLANSLSTKMNPNKDSVTKCVDIINDHYRAECGLVPKLFEDITLGGSRVYQHFQNGLLALVETNTPSPAPDLAATATKYFLDPLQSSNKPALESKPTELSSKTSPVKKDIPTTSEISKEAQMFIDSTINGIVADILLGKIAKIAFKEDPARMNSVQFVEFLFAKMNELDLSKRIWTKFCYYFFIPVLSLYIRHFCSSVQEKLLNFIEYGDESPVIPSAGRVPTVDLQKKATLKKMDKLVHPATRTFHILNQVFKDVAKSTKSNGTKDELMDSTLSDPDFNKNPGARDKDPGQKPDEIYRKTTAILVQALTPSLDLSQHLHNLVQRMRFSETSYLSWFNWPIAFILQVITFPLFIICQLFDAVVNFFTKKTLYFAASQLQVLQTIQDTMLDVIINDNFAAELNKFIVEKLDALKVDLKKESAPTPTNPPAEPTPLPVDAIKDSQEVVVSFLSALYKMDKSTPEELGDFLYNNSSSTPEAKRFLDWLTEPHKKKIKEAIGKHLAELIFSSLSADSLKEVVYTFLKTANQPPAPRAPSPLSTSDPGALQKHRVAVQEEVIKLLIQQGVYQIIQGFKSTQEEADQFIVHAQNQTNVFISDIQDLMKKDQTDQILPRYTEFTKLRGQVLLDMEKSVHASNFSKTEFKRIGEDLLTQLSKVPFYLFELTARSKWAKEVKKIGVDYQSLTTSLFDPSALLKSPTEFSSSLQTGFDANSSMQKSLQELETTLTRMKETIEQQSAANPAVTNSSSRSSSPPIARSDTGRNNLEYQKELGIKKAEVEGAIGEVKKMAQFTVDPLEKTLNTLKTQFSEWEIAQGHIRTLIDSKNKVPQSSQPPSYLEKLKRDPFKDAIVTLPSKIQEELLKYPTVGKIEEFIQSFEQTKTDLEEKIKKTSIDFTSFEQCQTTLTKDNPTKVEEAKVNINKQFDSLKQWVNSLPKIQTAQIPLIEKLCDAGSSYICDQINPITQEIPVLLSKDYFWKTLFRQMMLQYIHVK
ncbi:MAG: hypothetical protein JSR58_07495 [Verrucomicrobia bacterium]|nr:hypothetical protein [Verrucomicrobiota bacterium]